MSIVCEAHSLTRNCTQRLHSQPLGKKAHTAPVSDSSSRATSGSRVLKRCCTGRSNVTQQRAARRSSQLTVSLEDCASQVCLFVILVMTEFGGEVRLLLTVQLFMQRSALQSVPFNPKKLTVQYQPGTLHSEFSPSLPRRYTLTHNDLTGQLLLTIGPQYSKQQLSGWYSRLLRDEILAHWQWHGPSPILHIECHVSGRETWLAPPVLRDYIFRREMPLVSSVLPYARASDLQQFCKIDLNTHSVTSCPVQVLNIINFAEAKFLGDNPCLANAQVMVHLSSHVPVSMAI